MIEVFGVPFGLHDTPIRMPVDAGVKDGKFPSGKSATYDVILDLVNKGRDAMPTFKDTLTDQQKEDVIAFVLTL